jgi:hypothetical protein
LLRPCSGQAPAVGRNDEFFGRAQAWLDRTASALKTELAPALYPAGLPPAYASAFVWLAVGWFWFEQCSATATLEVLSSDRCRPVQVHQDLPRIWAGSTIEQDLLLLRESGTIYLDRLPHGYLSRLALARVSTTCSRSVGMTLYP